MLADQQYIDRRDRIRRQVGRRFNVSLSITTTGVIKDLVDAASCQLEDLECQDNLSEGEKYTKWALTHTLSKLKWPVRYLWVEHNVRYIVGGKVQARFEPEIVLGQTQDGKWQEDKLLWVWDGDEKDTMEEDEMYFERGLNGIHGMPSPRREPVKEGVWTAVIDVPVVYDRCFMVTRMQNEEIMDMFKNYHVSHMEDVRHDQ